MKSWTCIENCGACCKLDLNERENIKNILSKEDLKLIKSMTNNDGWCKYLDKNNMSCSIYKTRPHFCRVDKFSLKLKGYFKNGDDFLIDCCKQHIKSIYGKKSHQMSNYRKEINR